MSFHLKTPQATKIPMGEIWKKSLHNYNILFGGNAQDLIFALFSGIIHSSTQEQAKDRFNPDWLIVQDNILTISSAEKSNIKQIF